MKKQNFIIILVVMVFLSPLNIQAEESVLITEGTFNTAKEKIEQQLNDSIAQLAALRQKITDEKIPLNRKLNDLEAELSNVRQEYQKTSRLLDTRTLDLSNLGNEIKSRKEESIYLSNLLSEYMRNFESRLHIAEIQIYRDTIEQAKLAAEKTNMKELDVFKAKAKVIDASLDRLMAALGGTSFQGKAVDITGLVKLGTFVMVGPAVIFQSDDKQYVGTVEQRLGSLEPTVIGFQNPEDTSAVERIVANSGGFFPLDPTLGNAHKIEATNETFVEHVKKGGPVMLPIFILAGAAFLVAVYKWIVLSLQRKPSQKNISLFLNAIKNKDKKTATQKAIEIGGPSGEMLIAALDHIKEPKELVEEVMYETILFTRLKLTGLLPFIAISASSAPLLGLLGTVTGIINTFKLITVFGSGDVKTLSGGISEALITTKFGLIVAIPSMLMFAFLSRKAKGIIDQMEKIAVSFINQISKTEYIDDQSRFKSNFKTVAIRFDAENNKDVLSKATKKDNNEK